MMARHDEKTSAGTAKMLSGNDTGDKLAEIDEVLGCLVVQTVEHHEAELERYQMSTHHSSLSLMSFMYCSLLTIN